MYIIKFIYIGETSLVYQCESSYCFAAVLSIILWCSAHYAFPPLPSANSSLRCISSSSQTRQEPPEKIESDLCGIFAPVNATPTPTIPSNNIAILPSMVTAVVGLVCVLGTLLLFHWGLHFKGFSFKNELCHLMHNPLTNCWILHVATSILKWTAFYI